MIRKVIKKYLIRSIMYLPLKSSIYANLLHRIFRKSDNKEDIKEFLNEIELSVKYDMIFFDTSFKKN